MRRGFPRLALPFLAVSGPFSVWRNRGGCEGAEPGSHRALSGPGPGPGSGVRVHAGARLGDRNSRHRVGDRAACRSVGSAFGDRCNGNEERGHQNRPRQTGPGRPPKAAQPRMPRRPEKEGAGNARCPAAAARSLRRRRQEDDQAGEEARLRHLRAAQRRHAVRGGHLREDRRHPGDDERDGHQRRRDRGSRGRRRETARRPKRKRRANPANWSRSRRSRSPNPRPRSRPSAPTIRCACICAKWARWSFLSREGEIAIAKRIEAGREAMIAGLCESPLSFQAVIIWRDELNEGKVFLRDIIDLEATYAGPDAKQVRAGDPAPGGDAGGMRCDGMPGAPGFMPQPLQAVAAFGAARRDAVQGADHGRSAAAGRARRRRRGRRRRSRDQRSRSRRGRSRKFDVARRDRGRAQAESARDLRQHRRRLQAAAPPAGTGHPGQAQERDAVAGAGAQIRRSSRKRSSRR